MKYSFILASLLLATASAQDLETEKSKQSSQWHCITSCFNGNTAMFVRVNANGRIQCAGASNSSCRSFSNSDCSIGTSLNLHTWTFYTDCLLMFESVKAQFHLPRISAPDSCARNLTTIGGTCSCNSDL
jgi:hypothetical protein